MCNLLNELLALTQCIGDSPTLLQLPVVRSFILSYFIARLCLSTHSGTSCPGFPGWSGFLGRGTFNAENRMVGYLSSLVEGHLGCFLFLVTLSIYSV